MHAHDVLMDPERRIRYNRIYNITFGAPTRGDAQAIVETRLVHMRADLLDARHELAEVRYNSKSVEEEVQALVDADRDAVDCAMEVIMQGGFERKSIRRARWRLEHERDAREGGLQHRRRFKWMLGKREKEVKGIIRELERKTSREEEALQKLREKATGIHAQQVEINQYVGIATNVDMIVETREVEDFLAAALEQQGR